MEFMLLFGEERRSTQEPRRMDEMRAFAEELIRRGELLRGAPLDPEAAGARIRVRDGRALVVDGPFAESKEVLGGFWIVDVASRKEAIDIARRCPHARHGSVEVHRVWDRHTWAEPGTGPFFLFAFRMEPGLDDPDGSKRREMFAFGDALAREGMLLEMAPLATDPAPARVETRDGRPLVTDGPFAESKEAVGGYALGRVADRAAAIELAKRYPHARWGPVEVREIPCFDPV